MVSSFEEERVQGISLVSRVKEARLMKEHEGQFALYALQAAILWFMGELF